MEWLQCFGEIFSRLLIKTRQVEFLCIIDRWPNFFSFRIWIEFNHLIWCSRVWFKKTNQAIQLTEECFYPVKIWKIWLVSSDKIFDFQYLHPNYVVYYYTKIQLSIFWEFLETSLDVWLNLDQRVLCPNMENTFDII